jgi:hypothetical protein
LLVGAVLLAAAPSRAFWWGPSSESRWRDKAITIDGHAEDWRDREPDEAEGLAFAFANDDKDLYVMVSAHTKSLKQQMEGDFEQDFSIWIDTSVGKKRRIAVKLLAPAEPGDTADRAVATIGIDMGSAAAKDEAVVRIGPMDERGVLEARIPLSYLGTPLPKRFSIGLETSNPKKTPPAQAGHHPKQKSPKDEEPGQEAGGRGHARRSGMGGKPGSSDSDDPFEPIDLWIRVTLSSPPGNP